MLLANTNQAVLLPIQGAPLPYQYRFTAHAAGIPKQKFAILPVANPNTCWALIDQDTLEPCGFSKLTRQLFQYAEQQALWGKSIQVCANYTQTNGVMVHANRSAPQTLQLPMKPILVNSPDKVDGVAGLSYGALPPPQGQRLFWTQLPSYFWTQLPSYFGHNAWFVGDDNRLSVAGGITGFDCYSLWISALGLPIKGSAGVHTGDAFAALIKANKLPKGYYSNQLTVAQIVAATLNPWAFDSCIFWNNARLLFYSPNSGMPGMREFSTSGLKFLTVDQFAAGQSPAAVWKFGRYPKPYAVSGLTSVLR